MIAPVTNFMKAPALRSACRLTGDNEVPFHTHDEVELVFCASGQICIDVADQSIEASAGMLYILPGRVSHRQRTVGSWETFCILFSGDEQLLDSRPRVMEISSDERLVRWLKDLCALSAAESRAEGQVAGALLLTILARIAQNESRVLYLQSIHPALALAVEYLQENLGQKVKVNDLAAASRASYSHLSALFRKQFGCGPLRYHQALRLDRASALLHNPYSTVAEIASAVGFEDENYFVRLFRQKYGLSPGRWRKKRLSRMSEMSSIDRKAIGPR